MAFSNVCLKFKDLKTVKRLNTLTFERFYGMKTTFGELKMTRWIEVSGKTGQGKLWFFCTYDNNLFRAHLWYGKYFICKFRDSSDANGGETEHINSFSSLLRPLTNKLLRMQSEFNKNEDLRGPGGPRSIFTFFLLHRRMAATWNCFRNEKILSVSNFQNSLFLLLRPKSKIGSEFLFWSLGHNY